MLRRTGASLAAQDRYAKDHALSFMRRIFAGRTMRDVGNHRGARTISLALAAGLVAFESALVLGMGAFGIPGLLLVRFAGGTAGAHATPGGETIISKFLPRQEIRSPSMAEASPPALAHPFLSNLAENLPWPEPKAEAKLQARVESDGSRKPVPKAFGEHASKSTEELPWDAVEPVPYAAAGAGGPARPKAPEPEPVSQPPLAMAKAPLPSSGEIEAWVKSKATEFKGDERRRRLFHFELWLEPPADVKKRLVAVSYVFATPAVMPQSQISNEQKTGFRIVFGGMTCAEKITLTLQFADGGTQQVEIDGCRLLG
jgi:hypothetical protein